MRHPLHPALVHFPVACWSLATFADIASLHFGQAAWRTANTLLIIGTLLSIPALLAGFYELSRVPDDSPAFGDAYQHMGAMSGALVLYLASLMLRVDHKVLLAPGIAAIACSLLGFIALSIGGWLGGKLVYTHGLGR